MKQVFDTKSTKDTRPIINVKPCADIEQIISAAEIRNEMISFDKNSAPGPDGLKLQNLKSTPMNNILIIFNSCIRKQKIPPEWKIGQTTLIPKNDKPRQPDHYRPITVTVEQDPEREDHN